MTKIDVLDDVIEILIKKAIDSETQTPGTEKKAYNLNLKGDKVNGLPSASGKRK